CIPLLSDYLLTYSHCPVRTFIFFFFTDPATTEIYTLSLHDALPIYLGVEVLLLPLFGKWAIETLAERDYVGDVLRDLAPEAAKADRKSTRLNSSHVAISYAVFCLKKKKKTEDHKTPPTNQTHYTHTH